LKILLRQENKTKIKIYWITTIQSILLLYKNLALKKTSISKEKSKKKITSHLGIIMNILVKILGFKKLNTQDEL
jgi:hypothetical protein